MNLRQFTMLGARRPSAGADVPHVERCLTLLIDGAALNIPEIDQEGYRALRASLAQLSQKMPDRLPHEEKLVLVRDAIRALEAYRSVAEAAMHEQQAGWRALCSLLLAELLASLGVPLSSSSARPWIERMGSLGTGTEIATYRDAIEEFLHPGCKGSRSAAASPLWQADRSTENDNAAGLRGGGAAVGHLARVIDAGHRGFVVLFQLGCLDVISERFGMPAVEDCLMAVSAYLTHSLRNDDAIFHWSDSSLLAILLDRPTEQVVSAELVRIANQNRNITINLGARVVMLRVPLSFDVIPIERLNTAEDICRLSGHSSPRRYGL